ncbi:uncharacterized protein LOC130753787 isoform X1 [Actinidia eriantha]|uniref:uncharacterized protein LOC130753787 isoform X1 n=1 Tax=Actinidia eriantha TaxID=165200 RepID=UPI002586EFC2|nr:uncharacterized protein LOC130753787 isoform X1 [Actinidia eriantha]
MDDEKHAFYVVRKGDVIGIYRSLRDCQALLGSSVCDPSISVFKGYGLPKEAENYLVSHGLKNAVYSIGATDVQDGLFGQLAVCPFQQPASSKGKASGMIFPGNRSQHVVFGSTSIAETPQSKHVKLENFGQVPTFPFSRGSCIIEFDGASKGNPGLSGAGAVLRVEGGNMVCRLREGVGIATNNVAEYRALILGLNYALMKGYKHVRAQGDSKLVCMQVQGLWKTKKQNMADLCKVAKELKDKFTSFEIRHVERDFNAAADVQANLAIHLKNGEIQEEWDMN